jgi:hypothetical protein
MIEMEMNIYATNLANKPNSQKPMHSNEYRISETNFVHIASAVCGVKTDH